jgi:hypothetical protein
MESLDEVKAHQRMKGKKGGKWIRRKVDSPNKIQEDLIKGGRGERTSLRWSHQEN